MIDASDPVAAAWLLSLPLIFAIDRFVPVKVQYSCRLALAAVFVSLYTIYIAWWLVTLAIRAAVRPQLGLKHPAAKEAADECHDDVTMSWVMSPSQPWSPP